MPHPAISREDVHRLAEACGNDPAGHSPTATRLLQEQRRLVRFFNENAQPLGAIPAQVAVYMLTVCMRVFEQMGGRMGKVSGAEIDRAAQRVQAATDALLPADPSFAERARAVADRAQPNLLDEVLWALYDRASEERKEGEAELGQPESAMIYLMLWTAVEALDACWKPPASAAAA